MTELELRDIINLVLDEKEGFTQIIEQKDEEIERLKIGHVLTIVNVNKYYIDIYKNLFYELHIKDADLVEYGFLYLEHAKCTSELIKMYRTVVENYELDFNKVVTHIGAKVKEIFENELLDEAIKEEEEEKGKEEKNA